MQKIRLNCSRQLVLFVGLAILIVTTFSALLVLDGRLHGVHAQAQGMGQSPPYDATQVTVPLTPPAALTGQSSFQENCAPCHGAEGLGNGPTAKDITTGPPTAFADATAVWELSPAELFHTTKYGRLEKMMPPWSNRLDDAAIWNTVAYAWSLHTKEAEVAQGKELYAANCANCHGDQGKGNGTDASSELTDFTDLSYVTFKSQAAWDADWEQAHPEIGQEWSSADRGNVLEYIRTFSYRPPWESPYQAGAGVITGTVVQGTPGGAAVGGLPIVLDAFIGFDQVATFTATLDADGGFAFNKLSTDPNIAYLVSTLADGVSYSSDFAQLTPITTTAEIPLTVFGTTDDPAGLRINRSHLIVDHQPGALIVGEIYIVGNDSDRTYIGQLEDGAPEPVTVGLRVPPTAEEVTFENGAIGDRFQQVGDVIYDTMPVVPGEGTRQIIVRYAVPYKGTAVDLKQDFLYPVDSLSMLVADIPQLEVNAPEMELMGTQDMQGLAYQIWRKSAFSPQAIAVGFKGLLERDSVDPRVLQQQGSEGDGTMAALPTTAPPLEPWAGWMMAGLTAAGLLAAVGVALQRGTVRSGYTRQDLASLHDSLLTRIAHVDDLRALGEISEAEWIRQRSQLKAQLADVIQRQNHGKRAPA